MTASLSLIPPTLRPTNPRFSSGPCTKPPHPSMTALQQHPILGRSHRAAICMEQLKLAIRQTCELLEIPTNYKLGIVPASDTGAFEMAMWNLLGARDVEMLAWESFGQGWVTDCVKQLKLSATVRTAEYGDIVDLTSVDWDKDVCFTWNGTTSGVCVPSGDLIPSDRKGLTFCDATSAVFAMNMPWDKLDVVTFSWQKVLGGEAAHGMLILSPRAVRRIETYVPPWPLPKIFRLRKDGKLINGLFAGETINTPSMLVVENYLNCLAWAFSIGGIEELIRRANANARAIWDFCDTRNWIDNLASDPTTRSNTSVCLKFTNPEIRNIAQFSKSIAKRLEDEDIAYDIGAYRDAPPGLRIWCGSTIQISDIQTMLPWLEWAYQTELAQQ